MKNIWDDAETLAKLEKERDLRRSDGKRLTFDCLNLKCKGDRAYCSKGMRLGQSKDGSMFLVTVLKGITSGACKSCFDFFTEEGTSGYLN